MPFGLNIYLPTLFADPQPTDVASRQTYEKQFARIFIGAVSPNLEP